MVMALPVVALPMVFLGSEFTRRIPNHGLTLICIPDRDLSSRGLVALFIQVVEQAPGSFCGLIGF